MADVTVSLRVPESVHNEMKMHDEINWSAILRKSILEHLGKTYHINEEKARQAAKAIDKMREGRVFDQGESGVKTIREWRNKRR